MSRIERPGSARQEASRRGATAYRPLPPHGLLSRSGFGRMLAVFGLGAILSLSGCAGPYGTYGGQYYGYPGGWGRHGWNGGYSVGPHYTGRGWGGPGYRRRLTPRPTRPLGPRPAGPAGARPIRP